MRSAKRRYDDAFKLMTETPSKRNHRILFIDLPDEVLTHVFRFLIVPERIVLDDKESSTTGLQHAKSLAFCNSRLLDLLRQLLIQHRAFPLRNWDEKIECKSCVAGGFPQDGFKLKRGEQILLNMAHSRIHEIEVYNVTSWERVCPHFSPCLMNHMVRQTRLETAHFRDHDSYNPSVSDVIRRLPRLVNVKVLLPLLKTFSCLQRLKHLRKLGLMSVSTQHRSALSQLVAKHMGSLTSVEITLVDDLPNNVHIENPRVGYNVIIIFKPVGAESGLVQNTLKSLFKQYILINTVYTIVVRTDVSFGSCKLCRGSDAFVWYDDMVDGTPTHLACLAIGMHTVGPSTETIKLLRPHLENGFRAKWISSKPSPTILYGENAQTPDFMKSVFVDELIERNPDKMVLYANEQRSSFSFDVSTVRVLDLRANYFTYHQNRLDELESKLKNLLRKCQTSISVVTEKEKSGSNVNTRKRSKRLWSFVTEECPNIKVVDIPCSTLDELQTENKMDALFLKLCKLRVLHLTEPNYSDLARLLPDVLKYIRLYCPHVTRIVLHRFDDKSSINIHPGDLKDIWENIALMRHERPEVDIESVIKVVLEKQRKLS